MLDSRFEGWPKCPSTDKWENEVCYGHTVEYYLAIGRNEVLIPTITWMNFETLCQIKEASHETPHIV